MGARSGKERERVGVCDLAVSGARGGGACASSRVPPVDHGTPTVMKFYIRNSVLFLISFRTLPHLCLYIILYCKFASGILLLFFYSIFTLPPPTIVQVACRAAGDRPQKKSHHLVVLLLLFLVVVGDCENFHLSTLLRAPMLVEEIFQTVGAKS